MVDVFLKKKTSIFFTETVGGSLCTTRTLPVMAKWRKTSRTFQLWKSPKCWQLMVFVTTARSSLTQGIPDITGRSV